MPIRRPRRRFGASQTARLFFACLPDAETAARIHAMAERLKAEHRFGGTLILPEHLHVTLFHLGDWHELPFEIVGLAIQAAEHVKAQALNVVFRRVGSFRNRTGIYPFVLTDKDSAVWAPLRNALGAALKAHGLGGAVHLEDDFKPHVTLLREELRIKPIAVEPIAWTVRDFVLIHSLLGKTTHLHLGRWALSAAEAGD